MKWVLLMTYLILLTFRLWLRRLNLGYLAEHGHEVPRPFDGFVDQALLKKTTDYTLANSRAGLVETLFSGAVLVTFLFGGLLSWYDDQVGALTDSFIGHGVLFVLGLAIAQTFLDIPFSLYRTFVIEERFQFNTSTPKIWFTDLVKSLVVGALLLSIVTAGALWLVQASPDSWWLWVWAFLALITLLLMYLSPVLIEPLFFKFQPLQNEELAERVKKVMAVGHKAKEMLDRVLARSPGSSQARFYPGLPRRKRVCTVRVRFA